MYGLCGEMCSVNQVEDGIAVKPTYIEPPAVFENTTRLKGSPSFWCE